jgi:hypothetical protein
MSQSSHLRYASRPTQAASGPEHAARLRPAPSPLIAAAGNAAWARLVAHQAPVIQREAGYVPAADAGFAFHFSSDIDAIGPGKDFTEGQRNQLYEANHATSVLYQHFQEMLREIALAGTSEESYAPVTKKGPIQTHLSEVDHIYPKEKGGVNSRRNMQVLTAAENNTKGQTYPWKTWTGTRLLVTAPVAETPQIHKGDVFPIAGSGSGATVDFSEKLPGNTAVPIATARANGFAPPQNPA